MRILIFPRDIRDAVNPYGELLYRDMADFAVEVDDFSLWRAFCGRYDVFHLHWPEYYLNLSLPKALLGTLLVLFSTAWLRMRGTRILWTIHNPRSHMLSHRVIEGYFWRMFISLIDAFVSMSDSCTRWVKEDVPRLRRVHRAQIPHGHYRAAYPSPIAKSQARRALGLTPEQTVLLFFGGVSPYKNLLHLIAAFHSAALPGTTMVIAGWADSKKYGRQVELAANTNRRIKLDLRRIPRQEVPIFFSAADLIVLPFSHIMHSGSAILALSFNTPVLVPAMGSLPELQAQVGANWVQTYEGELTPAILRTATAWARDSNRPLQPDLSLFDWVHIVRATAEFYFQLCPQPVLSTQPRQQSTDLEPQPVALNTQPPS
jgi:beta-1,4-mannosyltransferase